MRRLSGVEWSQEAESAFRHVFAGTDPFVCPFQSNVESRALLYPVGYLLEAEQFDALAHSARAVGEHRIGITITEQVHDLRGPNVQHWVCEYWEWAEYQDLGTVGVLENALYSLSGSWGILISHEQHALIGGGADFMQQVAVRFPGFDRSIEQFCLYWKDNAARHGAETGWIAPLLEELYGQKYACELVERYLSA